MYFVIFILRKRKCCIIFGNNFLTDFLFLVTENKMTKREKRLHLGCYAVWLL
jgi:hypothetical protein